MQDLVFPVVVNGGDTDVEIQVSEKDAVKLMRYAEIYDSPEEAEELEDICRKLRKRILKGLADQLDPCEEIDPDDLEFSFGFPE